MDEVKKVLSAVEQTVEGLRKVMKINMKFDRILIRYGEISTKRRNRNNLF